MKKPNIILINCDDLGYGDVGCYGSKLNRTPALDRMAREGARFTDFYMASPVCSPSRGAMMTGCYPPRIGFGQFGNQWVLFPGDPMGLNPEETTVAKLLKQAGYATKIVGKWHCGDQPEFLPTRHGFDSYYGIPYSNDMGRQKGNKPSWAKEDGPPPLPLLRDEEVIQEQPEQSALTERYTEECVRFIRENKDKPFFLYFAHMYVHLPIFVPKQFEERSQNGRYGAAVEHVDWSVAVLLDELEQLGLGDDTLIIFTSDNGSRTMGEGGSNDPLRGKKGTTWEGGQRLPCIMRWPNAIPAGIEPSEIAVAIDFLPTFAALAGVKVPTDKKIDGKDIRSLMFGEAGAKTPHEAVYYYVKNGLCAVRCGDWKLHLVIGGEKKLELYNLRTDVGETENVIDRHPDVVAEIMKQVEKCREDLGDANEGITGKNCRPIGMVNNPDTLTHYDESHPYIIAEYDLFERG